MNWKSIKEKYPNGFNKFLLFDGTFDDKEAVFKAISLIYPERRLYDFFDENEIYIIILLGGKWDWVVDVIDQTKSSLVPYKIYSSRKEAEEAAFTKSFELLEEKL